MLGSSCETTTAFFAVRAVQTDLASHHEGGNRQLAGGGVAMSEHLSPLDATFLELEEADESAHMHIGGVMVFDPLPGGGPPARE